MNNKSILIIGAGIAGLSAGVYARKSGFDTTIFELHSLPGGLCTSWKRKGYTFDGCIHWLVGSNANSAFRHLWDEVGALDGKQVHDQTEFIRIVDTHGKTFVLYTDPDQLEAHMLELAPQDAPVIREFVGAIHAAAKMDAAPVRPSTFKEWLAYLPGMLSMVHYLPLGRKYGKVTLKQFTARFQDPFLRKALNQVFDMPDFPLLGVLNTLGWMAKKDAGYPIGGSLEFARGIEQTFLKLGGQIRYNARVERILVENGRAVGVRLTTGQEFRGDYVISAADGHATHFDMLESKFLTDEIRRDYDTRPIFEPLVYISLGIDMDLSDRPHYTNYLLEQPITVAGEERYTLGIKHYCYDPTLAPAGKSVVIVMYESRHAYWKALAEDREQYESEKKDIAIKVIDQINRRIPGFAARVEAVDVATPLTFERYTGNWQGSFEGWQLNIDSIQEMMQGKSMSKTVPGLERFYMIGQWVEPGGGLPPALYSARNIVQRICKDAGLRFKAKE